MVRDAGGGEIKEWYALAAYLQHFGSDGLPDQYAQPDGRKDVSRSWNRVVLVRSPGWPTFFALAALLLILAGAAFYCWAVYSRKSGPTGCIGCGKCVADGVCILTGKKVPAMTGKEREKP